MNDVQAPLLPDPSAPVTVPCGPRSYRLRVPRMLDRAALTREIVALGGRHHLPPAELRAMIDGVRAGMAESEHREAILLALGAQLDRWNALAQAHDEDDRETRDAMLREILDAGRELIEVEAVMRRHWPPYAAILGDNAAYPEIEALACARLFVVGWDGLGVPCPRVLPGQPLPDDAVMAIPPADLRAISAQVQALLAPSEAQRKN